MFKKPKIYFSFLILVLFWRTSPAAVHSDPLSVRVDPAYFSPNGDGLQDQVFIYPVLNSDLQVTRWSLEITRLNGHRVARLTGAGISALIKWDGLDKKGVSVPNGEYLCVLTIWGKGFKYSSDPNHIFVDNQVPSVQIFVSTPVLDQSITMDNPLVFRPTATDTFPIDRWQLQVIDYTGHTVYVVWSTGSIRNVEWEGKNKDTGVLVPQGEYKCVFEAWDKAGNESQPAFVEIKVNVTAKEMLQKVLEKIIVKETDMGLITQFDFNSLFVLKNHNPVLKESADKLLDEAALLINAYPDVPVNLDGYSHDFKKADRDRSVSSLYAWKVYSYLVKVGNVTASRLTVRGRGHSPMFDRRSVGLPVLKDGVEIVLVGNREW